MRRIILLTGVIAMILMAGGLPAQAALVVSDIFDNGAPVTGTKIKPTDPNFPAINFELSLVDYTPGTPLTSAGLILDLADDSSYWTTAGAGVIITLQGDDAVREFIVSGERSEYLIDISDPGILTELSSGSLSFTLGTTTDGNEKLNPDFIFYDAQINAEAVPIPPAMLLLGTGLIALVGIRRNFKN